MTKYHDKLKFQPLVEGNVKPVEVIPEQEENGSLQEDLSREEKEGNDNDINAKENNTLGKT